MRDDLLEVYGQIRRNCDEWEATLPPPPGAQRELVEAELRAARFRVLTATTAKTGRRCSRCGCGVDEKTPGCRACYFRHYDREHRPDRYVPVSLRAA